jgi:hypothetical protein
MITYLYERNLKGHTMKNILAENMLRFGSKNLDSKSVRTLKQLVEQTGTFEDTVASLGQLNVQLATFQTQKPLPGTQDYVAFGLQSAANQMVYNVFLTDQSLMGNNGVNKFVVGKTGTVSYATTNKENWKFTPGANAVSGILVVNDNVTTSGTDPFANSVYASVRSNKPFVVNVTSPRFNNLIVSLFVQNKPDYMFSFKTLGGYNSAKHDAALQGAINFIASGKEIGLFTTDAPTLEILKVL